MLAMRRAVPLIILATLWWVAPPAGSSPTRIVFDSHEVSGVTLGESATKAARTFDHLLGRASKPLAPTPGLVNCGLDAVASWRGFELYVFRARVVGFSLGPVGEPGGATSRGLRIGDNLAHARALYGGALTTTQNQGGAWHVTPGPRGLRGFLTPSGPPARATSRIQTIDLGNVGCPAMSP